MLYYKHVRRLSNGLRNVDAEAQAFAQARLANIRTVRAFANEKLEAERFQQVHHQGDWYIWASHAAPVDRLQ